jgi:hypothetical protein
MSFNKANMDVRVFMADRSVTQRLLAAHMNVSQTRIFKMLSNELSEKEKESLLDKIEECARGKAVHSEDVPGEDITEEVNEDVTMGPRFSIGDRVKIPSKQLCIGIVGDIWHSLSNNALMYAVDTEDGRRSLYSENQLEPAPIPTVYHFTAEISGNVAVVTMNATQGEKEWVYARGHAHILHDGEVGMAQAISYAARRMFESLDKQQENKIYFKKEEMK